MSGERKGQGDFNESENAIPPTRSGDEGFRVRGLLLDGYIPLV